MNEAEALARRCADDMWSTDRASQALGMEVIEVSAGRARLTMTVSETMANGHGSCHGGYLFTLADSAFAFACNTYGQTVVASQCSITFIRPGKVGDQLTATAIERSRFGRSGIYDVTVVRADGEVVAEFRGHSRVITKSSGGNNESGT